MPTWGEILTELNKFSTPAGTPDYDRVRRQYLQRLHDRPGGQLYSMRLPGLSPAPKEGDRRIWQLVNLNVSP